MSVVLLTRVPFCIVLFCVICVFCLLVVLVRLSVPVQVKPYSLTHSVTHYVLHCIDADALGHIVIFWLLNPFELIIVGGMAICGGWC